MFKKTMVRGLMAAALVVSATFAKANTFTYNIVDYPDYEADQVTGGTDSISGAIITDSDSGVLTANDLVGGTITITNPVLGTFSMPVSGHNLVEGNLTASPSSLILPYQPDFNGYSDNDLDFASTVASGIYTGDLLALNYGMNSSYGNNENYFNGYVGNVTPSSPFYWESNFLTLPDFVVATAAPIPEPAALALLGSALLGFGVVYLRRRRAKD